MTQKISLKEAERQVFRAAIQDGLWDIFIGCFFLAYFAGAPFLSPSLGDFWSSVVFLPFLGLVMLAIWLVRRHVLGPRVGVVHFGRTRKTRLKRFNVWILIVLLCGCILGAVAALTIGSAPGWMIAAGFGLVSLSALSTAAYYLDFGRLYVYGVLTAFSPLVGEWLYEYWDAPHHGLPITFGVSSTIMILTGLVIFVRLLRNSSIPPASIPPGDA
jgi:hypothetical protein